MDRWWLAAAMLVLLLLGLIAFKVRSADERHSPSPFDVHMRYLIAWIAARSDYSADVPLPELRFLPRKHINLLYYSQFPVGYKGQSDIFGFYGDLDHVIVLADSFDIRIDEPLLVHELVHHLQNMHRRKFRCMKEREREAYLIQRRYVQQTGIGTMPAWGFIMSLRCTNP